MTDPDERTLQSMLHVHKDELAKPFMDWLRANLKTGRESTDQLAMTDMMFRQIQGGNVCLNTIITTIENSYATLNTMRNNREKDSITGRAL